MKKVIPKQKVLFAVLILALTMGALQPASAVDALNSQQKALIEANLAEWLQAEVLHKYVGNNKAYDWYIDQADTGEYSNNNCGPSSAVMALKWLDPEFPHTAEEARKQYPAYGGWWNTTIISRYFDAHDVAYNFVFLDGNDLEEAVRTLAGIIAEENIAILCIDMNYVSKAKSATTRVGRFYDYADGHFLVVKGYVKADEKIYFEVYDPNSWGRSYPNGEPLGKDRYYLAEELIRAAVNWYQFAIVPK